MKSIELTQGQIALVDDDLFDRLSAFKWFAMRKHGGTFYAARRLSREGGGCLQYLHRFVWELKFGSIPQGVTIDHRNHKPLDNQISNLRLANQRQQMQNRQSQSNNSSGYIGVARCRSKWRADVSIDGKRVFLGCFADPFSAAWVRDQFVKEKCGPFAVLNSLHDRRKSPRLRDKCAHEHRQNRAF